MYFLYQLDRLFRAHNPRYKAENCSAQLWCNTQDPRNVSKLQSFTGVCNAFRPFIPNFARIPDSLNIELRNNHLQTFDNHSADGRNPLKRLREWLISPPLLALPRPKSNTPSILVPATEKSVLSCSKNNRNDLQNQLDTGHNHLHQCSLHKTQPITNASISYGHPFSCAPNSMEVDSPSAWSTLPYNVNWTSPILLGNPHNGNYRCLNTNSNSSIVLD